MLFAAAPLDSSNAITEIPSVSALITSLVIIYLASKAGAEGAARLRQPAVLGELVAGLASGVLSGPQHTAVLCMVIATTFVRPFLLGRFLAPEPLQHSRGDV